MRKPAWLITWDGVTPGMEDMTSRAGRVGEGTLTTDEEHYTFKLYDDDGEHYYSGKFNAEAYLIGDDESEGALINAWQWGMYDAGTTDLRIKLSDLEKLHGADSDTYRIYRDKIVRKDGWCSIFS